MDILGDSELVIFFHYFITFSYKSLAGFLFEAAKTGSGVEFMRLTAVGIKTCFPATIPGMPYINFNLYTELTIIGVLLTIERLNDN